MKIQEILTITKFQFEKVQGIKPQGSFFSPADITVERRRKQAVKSKTGKLFFLPNRY